MATISPIQVAIGLNMILDMYLKLKKEWPQVTPEDIKQYLESLEAKADANDAVMGV